MKNIKVILVIALTFFMTGTSFLYKIDNISSYSDNYFEDPAELNGTVFTDLNYLYVEDYDLSPEFDKDITEYTVKVDFGTDKLNITYRPISKNSTAEIIGNENLKNGSKVTIRVYDKNKTRSEDYVLTVVYSNSKVLYIILMVLLCLVIIGAIIGLILYILVKQGVLTLKVKSKEEIGKENYVK